MSVSVTMPQLGESVTEGTVTRWLKAVGDTVVADEPLLEVSTDKVDTGISVSTLSGDTSSSGSSAT
ncbi:MAG: biotin/lipoyl-containing protein, partial [Actinomycetes bacterium]